MSARPAARSDVLPTVADPTRSRPLLGTTPLVITDLVSEWPCYREWNLDRLCERFGSVTVRPFVTSGGPRNPVLKQVNDMREMSFAEALRHLYGVQRRVDGSLYLRIGQQSEAYEPLMSDVPIPDVGLPYQPAATGIWFSQTGNVTPAHHDWWHSFLIQVAGEKRYTLVHPLDCANVQRGWPAAARYDLFPAPDMSSGAMPDWSGEVRYEGVLRAGEILYIPPFWLHEVETLTDGNISIPTRFDTNQTVASDLFQLSQDGLLRDVTNAPTDDVTFIRSVLAANRSRFQEREREFVEALCTQRRLGITPEEMLAGLAYLGRASAPELTAADGRGE